MPEVSLLSPEPMKRVPSASVTTPEDAAAERVEIRILGSFRVRRADGSLVASQEWRTGKTADLLRLLAVRSQGAVPVERLLEALWPDVDEQRGRASLRTAIAQIRRILGQDSVERRLGGLVLRDAWVDAVAFRTLAREARRLMAGSQPARLVTVTREAEALYLGEFRAHNDNADWAAEEREDLAAVFRGLLADAADAAVELGWMRDAVDFATRSLAADPCSERASRALMQGYAGVGETSRALREFERCRLALAEELGADPSPLTRSVHLKLLTADSPGQTACPFIGRDKQTARLRSIIDRSLAGGRLAIVMVGGAPGSGKTRLISEACQETSARQVMVLADELPHRGLDRVEQLTEALGVASAADRAGDPGSPAIAAPGSLVVILAGAGLHAVDLRRMYAILSTLDGAVTVVLDGVSADLEVVCAELLAATNYPVRAGCSGSSWLRCERRTSPGWPRPFWAGTSRRRSWMRSRAKPGVCPGASRPQCSSGCGSGGWPRPRRA
ncbi:hypothetical protein BH20ACT5_BH20ACT5_14610 [soil metagenome]